MLSAPASLLQLCTCRLKDECSVTLMCFHNSSQWKPAEHGAILMWAFFFFFPLCRTSSRQTAVIQKRPIHQQRCSTGRRQRLRHPGGSENRLLDTICILDLLPELFLSSTPSFFFFLLIPVSRLFFVSLSSFSDAKNPPQSIRKL